MQIYRYMQSASQYLFINIMHMHPEINTQNLSHFMPMEEFVSTPTRARFHL